MNPRSEKLADTVCCWTAFLRLCDGGLPSYRVRVGTLTWGAFEHVRPTVHSSGALLLLLTFIHPQSAIADSSIYREASGAP